MIVLATDGRGLAKIHQRAVTQGFRLLVYIDDMFETGHDAANRATVRAYSTEDLKLTELALREDKKIVDKITKVAKMHP